MKLTKPIEVLAARGAVVAADAVSLTVRTIQRAAGVLPGPFGAPRPDGVTSPAPPAPRGAAPKPDDRSHTPPSGDPARPGARRRGANGGKRSPEATAAGVSVAGGPAIPEPPRDAEHVTEEATLVAQSADPGADGDVGPNIEISEPWDGYAKLRARDVADRLVTADVATAGAVDLYERAHKGRKLVLEAASQRLRTTG